MKLLIYLFGILLISASFNVAQAEKLVWGYLETVLLFPGEFQLEAKLDTGADNSSIHARILSRETNKSQDTISFEVTNKAGKKAVFKKAVVRVAKIRRHSGKTQERPVVLMDLCVGSIRQTVEVNLVNRKDFSYKLLIGRSFLANNALIDPSSKFRTKPDCK